MSHQSPPQPLFDTVENISLSSLTVDSNLSHYVQSSGIDNATNDYHHAVGFLYSYRGSSDTFASYRREIERLLHWCWFINKTSLPELRRQDVERFIDFCKAPPVAWIGTKTTSRYVNQEGLRICNPDWRPFVLRNAPATEGKIDVRGYNPSPKALQAIFSILSSFFTFLVQEEYMPLNPVALIRQKSRYLRKQQSKAQIRRLSELQWSYVLETAEYMAAEVPDLHERSLFVIQALYAMYLRISELAASERWSPEMGDFHIDMDGNWWFTTVGKGNKERDISVSDEMLLALKRYRLHRGLSAFPAPAESTPLVPKTRGRGGINSTRQIRNIVQRVFDAGVTRLSNDGFHEDAERLKTATVHWLRHTGISDDVKHRPREHVRDDAGHGSSATTDRYIDVEMRERHRSAKKKPLKPN